MTLRHYQVVGRRAPDAKDPNPRIYRMLIFSRDKVGAKSRFWYFMSKLRKMKKTTGEILAVNELHDKSPTTVKNYAIWLRYNSRSGTHNQYREYRALSLTEAVNKCYQDMAGRHRARFSSIHIIRTAEIPAGKCRRSNVTQFHNPHVKFPITHHVQKTPSRSFYTAFRAVKPTTSN